MNGSSSETAHGKLDGTLLRADAFQRRHAPMAVPIAVQRKFSEDESANLASMIAFWGVFSIFPLFLVFVTLLGFFLTPSVKLHVLTNIAGMFPLLDVSTVHSLSGQWWALILGLVSALWSGISVVRVTQFAFDSVWEIPYTNRAKLSGRVLRAVRVLATIGLGLVLSTLITGFAAGSATGISLGWYGRLAGYVIAIALDIGLFLAAFLILISRPVTIKDVLPGALLSGVAFWVLQSLSSLIISRYLHNAQGTYGHFGVVITILWWSYLQSTITMFGAQLNVVLKERLYPRSLTGAPATDADRRAYRAYARQRIYHTSERVDVGFTSTKQP